VGEEEHQQGVSLGRGGGGEDQQGERGRVEDQQGESADQQEAKVASIFPLSSVVFS